jgi:SanA protein
MAGINSNLRLRISLKQAGIRRRMAVMFRKLPRLKILWRWSWRGVVALLLGIWVANLWVLGDTKSQIYRAIGTVPDGGPEVALVLGTSKTLPNGWGNHFFKRRIEAAAELYHAGKIKHLLLSGDHSTPDYNEPADMRDALIAKGVPISAMTLDFAGMRTLDSVVRAREIFSLKHCIIVTDDFHLPRAVFLANHFGLQATGYEAKPLAWSVSEKTRCREYLARVKGLLDVYLLGTEPKHLGQKLPIGGIKN